MIVSKYYQLLIIMFNRSLSSYGILCSKQICQNITPPSIVPQDAIIYNNIDRKKWNIHQTTSLTSKIARQPKRQGCPTRREKTILVAWQRAGSLAVAGGRERRGVWESGLIVPPEQWYNRKFSARLFWVIRFIYGVEGAGRRGKEPSWPSSYGFPSRATSFLIKS